MDTRYRNEDIKINLAFTDSGGGDVDIDSLDELYVYIVHQLTKKIISKYNKAGSGDFAALFKTDSSNYYLWIDSSDTDIANLGIYEVEVNLVQTEADLSDTIQDTIEVAEAFILKDSVI